MPWAEALRLGNCAERMVRAGKTKEGFTGEEGEGAHGKMVISEVLSDFKMCLFMLQNLEKCSQVYNSEAKIHKIYG